VALFFDTKTYEVQFFLCLKMHRQQNCDRIL